MTYFNHNNDYPISIEEILIKPQTRTQIAIRQFILFNKRNGLKIVILNLGPKIVDCFVDHIHPIIYGHDHNHSEINDQNLIDYRANRIPGPNNSNNPNNDSINNSNNRCWDSHVFGFDAITLSHYILMEPIRTLTYSLNTENEFIIEGNNLLNFHNFLFNPFFFNLNPVANPPCLDEHYLNIRSSHESINVFTEHQALFGQFINRIPSNITNVLSDGSDFVCSTNPSSLPDSFLIATLTYKTRLIEISLEIDRQVQSNLRIVIKNGSIAFVPHDMNKFKVIYKFHW
ncbi:hypothetical protein SSS_01300 [Sarcoptes scabiei]|uniref:Uncharacterized protein n=1 Tax=Sarcoptes scabiei TaxID=52283 RepID=A0A132AM69_SARSC|nr:hypothetical protein SSS_01300 [Sarcoptes scabiei]KPM11993.1 hypothetical protein QR98_0105740 [Sarcoptes scabiei]UXI14315.1 hypothetical protein NH340_JMT00258 [Sarcoptes scabiei]